MKHPALFEPLQLGALSLPNRLVMAPLTRMRAAPGGIATPLMAQYYGQRAGAGLIITEGTAVSQLAHGYPASPGIYTAQQIAAWQVVTERVHRLGGRIFMQIQHNGRGSLAIYNPDGSLPVAPSAIRYVGKVYTPAFQPLDPETPHALETSEIVGLIETFTLAAANAMAAGCDGVEIQGANGHLIDQFLCDGSNQRSDAYGGSIEGRARFLLEIVDSISAAIGADRLGVRFSPYGRYGGISDTDPIALFKHVVAELDRRKIAYLHLIQASASEIGITDELHANAPNNAELFRDVFSGPLISAGAYTPESGAEALERRGADAIAFGRLFIANPDLAERVRLDAALNAPDRASFYGGDAHGYTDYPKLNGVTENDELEKAHINLAGGTSDLAAPRSARSVGSAKTSRQLEQRQ
jgi:N-ethylmaleimide reductase